MKKIFAIILVVLLIAGLAGCYAEKGKSFTSGGRFTVVEHNVSTNDVDNYILVDNETGVLYLIVYATPYRLAMTVLLDADGTPMIMEGYKNEDR